MDSASSYIAMVFELTTLLTVWFFYKANKSSMTTLAVLVGWLAIQGAISISGFYYLNTTYPPRVLLLVLPPNLFILILFITARGRKFIDGFDLKMLTLLHIIRIPVEVVLYWLFLQKTVPQLMTFEGRNFDVLSGLSAPIVYYFSFINRRLGRNFLIGWNFICLVLLLNIVINAIFSLPYPFQIFAPEQPNVAVLYFPYVWLPCAVVPLVLLSHLAAIRRLFRTNEVDENPDIPLIPVG